MRWHLMREIEERGRRGRRRRRDRGGPRRPGRRSTSRSTSTSSTRASRPGTGTPEPGGMLTREVLRAVRRIASARSSSPAWTSSRSRRRTTTRRSRRWPPTASRSRRSARSRPSSSRPAGPLRFAGPGTGVSDRDGGRRARAPLRPRPARGPGRPRPVPRAGRRGPAARSSSSPSGPAASPCRSPRPATTSPASTSTRRCSRGPAPQPRPPGAAVAGRLDLVEGDARTIRLPDAGTYRLAVRSRSNSLFLMGTRREQAAARARRSPPISRRAASPSSTSGCPTPTTSRATTAGSCLEYVRRDPETGRTVTKTGSAIHDAATGIVRLTTIFERRRPGGADGPLGAAGPAAPRRAGRAVGFAEAAGLVVEVARRRLRPRAARLGARAGDPGRATALTGGPDRRPTADAPARAAAIPRAAGPDGTFGAGRRVPDRVVESARCRTRSDSSSSRTSPRSRNTSADCSTRSRRSSCSTSSPTGRRSPGWCPGAAARRRPRRRPAAGPGQGHDARRPAPPVGRGHPGHRADRAPAAGRRRRRARASTAS